MRCAELNAVDVCLPMLNVRFWRKAGLGVSVLTKKNPERALTSASWATDYLWRDICDLEVDQMYRGTVRFSAEMSENRLAFAPFAFSPQVQGVDRVVTHTEGNAIVGSVEVSSVQTPEDGTKLARSVIENALNRLSYANQIVIRPAKVIERVFTSMSPGLGIAAVVLPGVISFHGQVVDIIVDLGPLSLAKVFEPAMLPGEEYFGALRSARLSIGPVEEFMHLYAILLELLGDKQLNIDAFIVSINPQVPQSPSQRPNTKAGEMETIFTRLRNELAHKRVGVKVDLTKQEMAACVGDLREIVKEAIRQSA